MWQSVKHIVSKSKMCGKTQCYIVSDHSFFIKGAHQIKIPDWKKHTHTRREERKREGERKKRHNNNNIIYIYDKAVSKLTIPRYVKVNAVLLVHWLTVIWFFGMTL